jgi:hypothetical protein
MAYTSDYLTRQRWNKLDWPNVYPKHDGYTPDPPATVPCSHCSTPIDAHPHGHNLIDGLPVCLPCARFLMWVPGEGVPRPQDPALIPGQDVLPND